MKRLAFAATSRSASINAALDAGAASRVEGAQVELLDLSDCEMPLYSRAREAAHGALPQARRFFENSAQPTPSSCRLPSTVARTSQCTRTGMTGHPAST